MWEPAACALSDSRFPLADREMGAFLKFATTDVCVSASEWADQEKDPRADPLIYSLTTARIAFK